MSPITSVKIQYTNKYNNSIAICKSDISKCMPICFWLWIFSSLTGYLTPLLYFWNIIIFYLRDVPSNSIFLNVFIVQSHASLPALQPVLCFVLTADSVQHLQSVVQKTTQWISNASSLALLQCQPPSASRFVLINVHAMKEHRVEQDYNNELSVSQKKI